MKTDSEGLKKEVKEDFKKFTEDELKKSLKAMKNDFESLKNFTEKELKSSMKTTKNDFEGLKKEVKEDLKQLTFDRDHHVRKAHSQTFCTKKGTLPYVWYCYC